MEIPKWMCIIFTLISLFYTITNYANAKLLWGTVWWIIFACWVIADGITLWRDMK